MNDEQREWANKIKEKEKNSVFEFFGDDSLYDRFVTLKKEENEDGYVGLVCEERKQKEDEWVGEKYHLVILLNNEEFNDRKWNVPIMKRYHGGNFAICFSEDYEEDLFLLSDELIMILFHELGVYRFVARTYRWNENRYLEDIDKALKDHKVCEITIKGDRYAVRHLGRERVLSGLRAIKERLMRSRENDTKAYELWAIEHRIKRIVNRER